MADESKIGTDWQNDELDAIVADYFATPHLAACPRLNKPRLAQGPGARKSGHPILHGDAVRKFPEFMVKFVANTETNGNPDVHFRFVISDSSERRAHPFEATRKTIRSANHESGGPPAGCSGDAEGKNNSNPVHACGRSRNALFATSRRGSEHS